jgi:hypothetical protein
MKTIILSLVCIITIANAQYNYGKTIGKSKDELDFDAFKVRHSKILHRTISIVFYFCTAKIWAFL